MVLQGPKNSTGPWPRGHLYGVLSPSSEAFLNAQSPSPSSPLKTSATFPLPDSAMDMPAVYLCLEDFPLLPAIEDPDFREWYYQEWRVSLVLLHRLIFTKQPQAW